MSKQEKGNIFGLHKTQEGDGRERLRLAFVQKRYPKIQHLIPNAITVAATCFGLLGLLFALKEVWHLAVLAVIFAGIMDALDGRMARALGSASHFGAELDSLSDVIAFGVCPAMILYVWGMEAAGNWGMMGVLLFTVCCLLRLARFNTMMMVDDDPADSPILWQKFFQGLPAPMGGGLLLLPIVIDLANLEELWPFLAKEYATWFPLALPLTLLCWTALISFLMISTIPVYSLKKVRVSRDIAMYAMALGVPLVVATLVSAPWMFLMFLLLMTLFSIPFSVWSFHRYKGLLLQQEKESE